MKAANVRINVTVNTSGAGKPPKPPKRPKRRPMTGRQAMFFTKKEAIRKLRSREFGERF